MPVHQVPAGNKQFQPKRATASSVGHCSLPQSWGDNPHTPLLRVAGAGRAAQLLIRDTDFLGQK